MNLSGMMIDARGTTAAPHAAAPPQGLLHRGAAFAARTLPVLVLACFLCGYALTQAALPPGLAKEADDLTQKFGALSDEQKKLARVDAKLPKSMNDLVQALDGVRDEDDYGLTLRAADRLADLLANGRLTAQERQTLAAHKKAKDLETTLYEMVKGAARVRVHSATYGDHRTRRTCVATAYFKGRCAGESKCPPDTENITGARLCGFEPAPMADEGVSVAKVNYSCGSTPQAPIELRGNGKIVCGPDAQ